MLRIKPWSYYQGLLLLLTLYFIYDITIVIGH